MRRNHHAAGRVAFEPAPPCLAHHAGCGRAAARAVAFYEALGLVRRVRRAKGGVFFQAGGQAGRRVRRAGEVVLSLDPRHDLAADAGVIDGRAGVFGGIAPACNRLSRAEADTTLIRCAG